MEFTDLKTLIIGLGEIGYNNAEYMTNLGLNVDGFDIEKKAVTRALNDKVIKNEASSFAGYDHYIICVSTHDPKNITKPSFEGLIEVTRRLKKEGKEGALLSIESTISKGISNQIFDLLKHKLHVAHVPHRYYSGDKKNYGVKQLRVLGACKECCLLKALHFYATILHIPIFTVKAIETAELCKIIENSYRFLEIAFVEELKIFCDNEQLDYKELREAINSKWNVNLLEAQGGIGGHCLPKDTLMFYNLQQKTLPFSTLAAAIQSDKKYRKQSSDEVDSLVFLPELVTSQIPYAIKMEKKID